MSTYWEKGRNSGKEDCPTLLLQTLRSRGSCFDSQANNKARAKNTLTNPISEHEETPH